jgi:hypothetical protein
VEQRKQNGRRILNMLAEGKISATDADGLLAAMADTKTPQPVTEVNPAAPKSPKYLRVQVVAHDGDNSKVNIRVPFNLIRAGVRLTALSPIGLHEQINKALKENGDIKQSAWTGMMSVDDTALYVTDTAVAVVVSDRQPAGPGCADER